MNCINFGCGLSVASGWKNYDASPTLFLQRLPVFGKIISSMVEPQFPSPAKYGDITKELPEESSGTDLIYCSHVLEHLALEDFRNGLREVYRLLKNNGVFRGVLPDLQTCVEEYVRDAHEDACSRFMNATSLGVVSKGRGFKKIISNYFGNSNHLWMWDFRGLSKELEAAGFCNIRKASFGDSENSKFLEVENSDRWIGCLGFECIKIIEA